MQSEKLTLKSRETLSEAQRLACKYSHQEIDGEHLAYIGQRMGHLFFAVLFGCRLLLLTGCSTVRHPSASELDAIKAGYKSIVLLRATVTTEKSGQSRRTGIPFEFYIVSLDQPKNARRLYSNADFSRWTTPSITAGKQGWRYLVLAPGDYYVELEPKLPAVKINTNTVCFLHVPEGAPVVYAGSFCFNQRVIKTNWLGKIADMGLTFYTIESGGIQDESVEAGRIAGESLSQFGRVTSSLGVSYDDLSAAVANITNHYLAKVEIDTGVALETNDVGNDPILIAAAPFLAPAMLEFDLSRDPGEDRQAHELAGIGFLIAAYPFAAAADQTVGEATRKKWMPYAMELEKEFIQFNLVEHLTGEIGNRLSTVRLGVGSTGLVKTGSTLILQVRPYRVALRETRFRRFALEIAVNVGLFDLRQQRNLWRREYVYTDFAAAQKKAEAAEVNEDVSMFLSTSYETLIHASSTPHKLDDYKGAAGVELFHHELSAAANAISDDIASRFIAAGFY